MKTKRLSRRGVVTGCAALPALAGLFHRPRTAAADGAGKPPLRLLIFLHLEGQVYSIMRPTGTQTDFTLGAALKSLDPWKSRMIVFDGIHNGGAVKARRTNSSAHGTGMTGLLTGNGTPDSATSLKYIAPSASIDQALVPFLRGPTRLGSLEIGVSGPAGNVSYANYPVGGGPAIRGLGSPQDAFDRIFGGAVGSNVAAADLQRIRAQRKSVLDYLDADLAALQRQVPRDDAPKLQAHLQAVRALETQLTATISPTCASGERPGATTSTNSARTNIPEVTKLQMDLLVQALACDVTRVASFSVATSSWSGPAPFDPINVMNDSLHGISHADRNTPVEKPWTEVGPKIVQWGWEQQAYLMQKMSQVLEGDGSTLLDNTLILSMSEFSESSVHTVVNIPTIVVGGARGYFKTGRFLSPDRNNNDLFVSIANALGVPLTTFGAPDMCRGPIAEMRG